jgi:hypothetical protein
MANLDLPPREILMQLLTYNENTGHLFWNERPESMFTSAVHSAAHQCKKWNSRFAGKIALNAARSDGYRRGAIFGKNYMAHRVIWKIVHGSDPDQIDHADGSRTNNKIVNLRDVSAIGNRHNMAISSKNTSGQSGVRWQGHRFKWQAFITVNYEFISLGTFANIEDAIAARKAAEVEYNFHPNHGRKAAA